MVHHSHHRDPSRSDTEPPRNPSISYFVSGTHYLGDPLVPLLFARTLLRSAHYFFNQRSVFITRNKYPFLLANLINLNWANRILCTGLGVGVSPKEINASHNVRDVSKK